MPHPQVGLGVGAEILLAVDLDEVQRVWHDVAAAVGKGHSGPLLQLVHRALDDHRVWRRPEDGRAEPLMGPDPRIEMQAIATVPAGKALHVRQRVTSLQRWPYWRDHSPQPR